MRGGFGQGDGGNEIDMRCAPGDARSRGFFSAYDNILVGLYKLNSLDP
jgi:hypothetical protein